MEEKKIKRILEEYKEETKRHFDIVAEKIEDKIALVAEQVGVNTEKLKEHDLKLDSISEKLKEQDLKFESISEKLKEHDQRFENISEKLKEHDKGFIGIEEKLKEHDKRFCAIEEKLKEHDKRFIGIDKRFITIEGKLKEHDKRFDKIEDTLEIIKLDIEFIKNELKQKVGRDEFAALEKRVSLLEAKVNKLK
jgi:chromosome segregation ATPase